MDILLGILCNGSGSLMSDGIKAVVNYLQEQRMEPDDYSKLLKVAAKMLLALRDDNEQKIRQFQNHTRRTSRFYNEWHISVPRIVSDLEKLQTECEKNRNLLEDFSIRSILHEKVRSSLDRVDRFLEQGKFTEDFLVDQPPESVVMIDSVPDITKFATLKRPLEDILSLLSDEEVKTVVIWGPLGVGKTTIMQYLNNHEEVAGLFQIVIWIKVSEERTMEKLQMDIASRLNLNLRGTETDSSVARRISEELKARKYLILLDDVRGVINHGQLKGIGVPDKKDGSKVVLTTENRGVCFGMESCSEIEVERLNQGEAWEMFKQMVTDQKLKIPGIKNVAQLVAEQCGGLPLVIKMVASYFKLKRSAAEWRAGLRELENGLTVGIPSLTQIHEFVKCCYDDLEDEKKRCFLHAALHPADTMISSDYLVTCWAVEKLCDNIVHNGSFCNACDKGYDTLGRLIDVSLLQADKRMVSVKVNKVVRQVALHISSQDHAGEFLIGDQTETSPASQMNNDWEQATRIFMIDAKLEDLPKSPRCSMLLSLLLQKNPHLKAIPPLFFETMQKLLVLNLCQTAITSLPASFKKLIGLKALFLNDCESFSRVPSQIAQLCHLEVFDIRGCKVIFIPSSIKKLGQLRCLRVSYYKPVMMNGYEGKKTDYNVISKLIKLEELVIDVLSHDQWCTEARNVIQQVASLKNLTSLKMCFPKPEDLRTLMERRQECQVYQPLSSFQFSIGSQNSPKILDYFDHPIERYLGYNHNGHHNGSTICNGFPTIDALDLSCNDNVQCLSDFIQDQGLNGVSGCLVEQCNNMVTIINGNNAEGTDILPILPSLQQLHVRNLTHLKSIFAGRLSGGSLYKLQTLVVKSCPKLTEISSNGLIQQLPQLLKITVDSCEDITQLIKGSGGSGSMSSIQVLELVDMKNLKSICADESLAWPKLKELRIVWCNELRELPFNKENAAGLKLIRGQRAWWNDLPNNEFKRHFQSSGILRFEAGSGLII